MRTTWGVLLLCYLTFLAFGITLISSRNIAEDITLKATRNLGTNHLLRPEDVSLLAERSLYLSRNIEKDEVLKSGDVVSLPTLPKSDGETQFSVNIAPENIKIIGIDVGLTMLLCPVKIAVVIKSVICGDGAKNCVVIAASTDLAARDVLAEQLQNASFNKDCG
jgi:hypothetical protein